MTVKEEMTLARTRRNFTGEEKVRILKRHLVDKVPVSDLCDEQGLHPTLFYKWQKEDEKRRYATLKKFLKSLSFHLVESLEDLKKLS